MKRSLFLWILLLFSAGVWAQSVTVSEFGGWFETAYAEWLPLADAESYNVYYSGNGITDQKVDNPLIRSYGSYFRADIPGLAAGDYTIKIVPVISGSEADATVTGDISVQAHDRTGFAFDGGRVPGAYQADGTPKSGAVILYISENTKNTVSLDVTGANVNPCVGLQTILEGFKKGSDLRPLIVRFVGQVSDFEYSNKGDIVVENKNNASSYITLEGIGEDAVADGWGIRVKNASNVEIRNIGTMNCDSDEGDNIGLQQNNDHIWVHNCDFFYGGSGGDADQAKGDGALDCKLSTYVTFSYNHFWDSGKCNLLGLSEGTTSGYFITYHHNWYDHSDSRHPRVRFYSAHVYNNYYDGNSKYGIGSTLGSSVFSESNYFRHCKYPMLTSMQGSDVYDASTGTNDYGDMPTFSSEDGGTIKAYNNYMEGQRRFIPYGDPNTSSPDPTVDFDAYVVASRNETVPSTVKSAYGGNTYNNFDVDASIMYDYTAQSPEDAKATIEQFAGRMNGGDLQWTFDDSVDDASYAVNTALKSALGAYETDMVFIQGEDGVNIPDPDPTDTLKPVDSDRFHNFTLSGLNSTFYSIAGNLSDSKGTVDYGGLTLTQCLKMESSTTISFTATEEGTLTLVFNSDFTGRVKVDGVNYNAVAGLVELTVSAGEHTIAKGDSGNVFFMSLAYPENGDSVIVGVDLIKGWNLVSVPFVLDDASIATIFPNADIVKNFDGFFDKSIDAVYNSLSEVVAAQGYLVYNSVAETLSFEGNLTSGTIDGLQSGWNIVGSPWSESKTVEEAFGTELSNITVIKTFDATWEAGGTNTLTEIEPGKAYYVYKQ